MVQRPERGATMDDQVLMDEIGRAQALKAQGDRAGARALYAELWAIVGDAADRYGACLIAHFMAHTQTEPAAQLQWHQRALAAAEAVGDERVQTFYPSLHANLAEVSLRLGDPAAARRHVEQARAAASNLADDGYGQSVHLLIDRI